jgi:hypothetical protein
MNLRMDISYSLTLSAMTVVVNGGVFFCVFQDGLLAVCDVLAELEGVQATSGREAWPTEGSLSVVPGSREGAQQDSGSQETRHDEASPDLQKHAYGIL